MSYLRYLCLFAYKSGVQHKFIVLWFFFLVFSSCLLYVANFSVLSIFDCPFGILERLFTECGHRFYTQTNTNNVNKT
jgi:hypothetical protein